MNSIVTAKFDKCGINKDDVFSRKVSNAQEKVRGMLKAEFMKWIFRFAIIKLRFSKREINFFFFTRDTLPKSDLYSYTSGTRKICRLH